MADTYNPDVLIHNGELVGESREFHVINTNPSGTGSLKQAIIDASQYQTDICNILFDENLFESSWYVNITMDTTNPIGTPKGIINVGVNLGPAQRVILDFGDANPLYASNTELNLIWQQIVFKNCKRTGNPIIYSSYTGSNECYMAFERCAFIDFATDNRYNICSTSGAGTCFFTFSNCIFVPARDNPSPYGDSWIGKTNSIVNFENCTVWVPGNVTSIPLNNELNDNAYSSLLLTSDDLSTESWASTWMANAKNYMVQGEEPEYDDNNKVRSYYASISILTGAEYHDTALAVDYWGIPRPEQTTYGAIRDIFTPLNDIESLEESLLHRGIPSRKIKCDATLHQIAVTATDFLLDVGKTDYPGLPEPGAGSYIWKEDNPYTYYYEYPVSQDIDYGDITIGSPHNLTSGGFKLTVDYPYGTVVSLPDFKPTLSGELDFSYRTCIDSEHFNYPTTFVYATKGTNVIMKNFWLPDFYNNETGTVSVRIGMDWKDSENNTLTGFNGCDYTTYHLDSTVTQVNDINQFYIYQSSIKFYQSGENVTYYDTNGNDVTQALLEAGLIIVIRNSWLTDLFGSELVQSALYAMDCPMSVQEADTQFG